MDAAPHLSCIGGTRAVARATCSRSTARTASAISSRCAATCRRAPATPASSATRASSSHSSARRPATGSTSTSPRYPEYHPQARSRRRTTSTTFKRKIDAGANSAITQYFYNADAYWHFVDACARGGHQRADRARASCRSAATRSSRASPTPAAPRSRAGSARKLESYGDDTASIRAFGLDVVTDLCAGLLARGAPGLHFYTLNQASLTTTIWQRLGTLTARGRQERNARRVTSRLSSPALRRRRRA